MKLAVSDVATPLGAVSAFEDNDWTVVFSKKWGNYIENDKTGEYLPIHRRGGTYRIRMWMLPAPKSEKAEQSAHNWRDTNCRDEEKDYRNALQESIPFGWRPARVQDHHRQAPHWWS